MQSTFAATKAGALLAQIALLAQMMLAGRISLLQGLPEPRSSDQGEAGYLAVPGLGIPVPRFSEGRPSSCYLLPRHCADRPASRPNAPTGAGSWLTL